MLDKIAALRKLSAETTDDSDLGDNYDYGSPQNPAKAPAPYPSNPPAFRPENPPTGGIALPDPLGKTNQDLIPGRTPKKSIDFSGMYKWLKKHGYLREHDTPESRGVDWSYDPRRPKPMPGTHRYDPDSPYDHMLPERPVRPEFNEDGSYFDFLYRKPGKKRPVFLSEYGSSIGRGL